MGRANRREKTEAQLRTLEAQFSTELVQALRACAAGTWGMFGRYDAAIQRQPELRSVLHSHLAERLIQMSESIRWLRDQLGYTEPFPPAERYIQYRAMHSANSPGEPRLAAQFLAELHDRLL